MSDPANWKVGDLLKYIGAARQLYTPYELYTINTFRLGCAIISCNTTVTGLTDSRWELDDVGCFKWHSRPSSEQ